MSSSSPVRSVNLARQLDDLAREISGHQARSPRHSPEGEERRAPLGQSVRQAITRHAGWARIALEHRIGYRRWVRRWWHASGKNGQAPNRAEWHQMSAQWWATQWEWESAGARLQQKARSKRKEPDLETSQEAPTCREKPTLCTWTAEYTQLSR